MPFKDYLWKWRWLLIGLIMSTLLPFLYVQSNSVDYGKHALVTNHLMSLEKYQFELDKNILATNQNIFINYDSLTESEIKLRKETNKFIGLFPSETAKKLMSSYDIYKKNVLGKLSFVEDYKSDFSKLKTSLSYFHLLISRIKNNDKLPINLKMKINDLSTNILIDANFNSHHKDISKSSDVIEIKNLSRNFNKKDKDLIEESLLYMNLVVNYSEKIKILLNKIINNDISIQLNKLIYSYNKIFQHELNKSEFYRLALFISSLILMLAIVLMIKKQLSISSKLSGLLSKIEAQQYALDQHGIVSIADVKGDIIYANKNFCKISGYSEDELIGRNHRMLKHGDHSPEFYKDIWKTITKGNVWHGEIHNQGKINDYWVYSTIVPILNDKGKPFQYISMRTDITERKYAEKSLNTRQMQISTINQALALFISDPDPVASFSHLLPDILALTESEYGFIAELMVDDNDDRYLKAYAATNIAWDETTQKYYEEHASKGLEFHDLNTLFGHVVLTGDMVFSNKPSEDPRSKGLPNGHPPLNAFLGIPIYFGEKLTGVIALANRKGGYNKEVAEILSPVTNACAHLIEALKAERERLRNALELKKARDNAEAAARAKSNFLATMSHEIRTPMNGVLGMLHLLNKTNLEEKQQRYVNTATGSGEMLLTVINDILDFSKIEADKLVLESIPFDPVSIVEETAVLLAETAHKKGLELICSVDASVRGMVKGDPSRLRQVLTNLINNAIKFTEKGHVVVHANAIDNRIWFGVVDTGIGISKEQRKHLFKAFTQVDSSHNRKYGGTGLGLVISQRLIEAMGGELRVASAAGLGSEFAFELPLESISDDLTEEYSLSALVNQHILLVDDNSTNLLVLENILQSEGINHIHSEESAQAALAELVSASEKNQPYDIAIIDMQMPGMDGNELALHIRKDIRLRNMKLVMLSSVDFIKHDIEFDAWLTKPVRQSDLFNALLMIIGEEGEKSVSESKLIKTENFYFKGKQLLLVEDNHVNQQVAEEILTEAGFAVDICENGQDAVRTVQQNVYDIVLMDIQMPVMDGLEATRKIRSMGRQYAHLPIIAMTAHALSGDSDTSIEAGMNGHVTKPIDPDKLFKTISHWVKPDKRSVIDNEPIYDKDIKELPDLPGIDVAAGLKRMCGNWSAYKRVLIGFHDKQKNSGDMIAEYIQQEQWDEASSIAHTLKGSGGNISADNLYKDAAALEQACRSQDPTTALPLLHALVETLDIVINGLSNMKNLSDQIDDSSLGENNIEEDQLSDSLDTLIQLLDSDLGAAQSLLEKLQQQTRSSDWKISIDTLVTALNNFDIDAVKHNIQVIKQRIG